MIASHVLEQTQSNEKPPHQQHNDWATPKSSLKCNWDGSLFTPKSTILLPKHSKLVKYEEPVTCFTIGRFQHNCHTFSSIVMCANKLDLPFLYKKSFFNVESFPLLFIM